MPTGWWTETENHESQEGFPGQVFDLTHEVTEPQRRLNTGSDTLPDLEGAIARASMYRFLSTFYLHPPHPQLLQLMIDGDLLRQIALLFGHGADLPPEILQIYAAASIDPALLEREYMDLFAVPSGRYVFPFEDVDRGEPVDAGGSSGGLPGSAAISVTRLYRQAGAQIDPICRECPTHIGVELSFMSFLCQKEARGQGLRGDMPQLCPGDKARRILDEIRKLRLIFLTEHLNGRFVRLSRAIHANGVSEFYRDLALLTACFLSWDTASLLAWFHVDAE